MFAGAARAELHVDIDLNLDPNNALVTLADATPERVFTGDLLEFGLPGFTNDPGWNASNTLAPGARIGLQVTDSLAYWDPNTGLLGDPPLGEILTLVQGQTPRATVTATSGPLPPFDYAIASAAGGFHVHLNYQVTHPDYDPGDPFNNPISDGAYVLYVQNTSDLHGASREYAIVLGEGLTPEQLDQAIEKVRERFESVVNCPGDLTGDLQVNLADLGAMFACWQSPCGDVTGDGNTDLSDLGIMFANWNTICE